MAKTGEAVGHPDSAKLVRYDAITVMLRFQTESYIQYGLEPMLVGGNLIRERLWQIFGAILLVTVFSLMFGIILAGAIGWITISPVLILGLILVVVFVGFGAIREPGSIQKTISRIVTIIFSSYPGDSNPRAPQTSSPQESQATGFDRVVEVADEESTVLADQLRRMRAEFGEVGTDELAQTLALGIQTRNIPPMQQVLQSMQKLLNSRDFAEESHDLSLRVIQRDNDTIYAQITEEHGPVDVGLEFDLYINETVNSDGNAEVWPKQVGTAEVVLVEPRFCGLEIISWTDQFDVEAEDRMEYIMVREPTIRFNEDVVSGVEWDDLEQAYESLRQLAIDGEITHAN